MARATRQSVALNDEMLPNLEVSARPDGQPALQAAPAAPRVKRRKHNPVTFPRVMCGVFFAGMCMGLLFSQMKLTQLTSQISQGEAALDELNSQYVSLKTKQEQSLSLTYVEDYAQNKLGMVRMDASQVEYVEMANPEITEVTPEESTVGEAVSSLMRSFTAVLEYLQ